jgi:hypothetical protein
MAQPTHGTQSAQLAPLSGVYAVTGFTGRSLARLDGLTLSINDTKKAQLGYGDAARYVSVSQGLRSDYAGNLYGPTGLADARATETLDGCQFQDRASRVRYVITQTTADTYTVAPLTEATR